MQLINKNILVISPEPWGHISVSKHHYAIHLSKRGNKVIFLNPPTNRFSVEDSEIKNLRILNYRGFAKGYKYLPKSLREKMQSSLLKSIERLAEIEFDIIWSFDNSVFFDLDIPNVLTISHIVDLKQNFQTKRAAGSANICFGVTDEIVNRLLAFNHKSFKIGHGLSLPETICKAPLPGINLLKAVYVGNLAMRHLDWKILYEACKNSPKVDFIFIGPNKNVFDNFNETHIWKKNLMKLKNAFFLEAVKSEEVLGYLIAADALLISYQEKFHRDQSNSHKILEYLYSGKPIIATYTTEYDGLSLLNMVKKNQDWPSLFQKTFEEIHLHNEEIQIKKRVSFALSNTYDEQIHRIEKILMSL